LEEDNDNAMRSVIILLILLYSIVSNAQVDSREIRKGNREYSKKAYSEAEIHYRKALEKMPDSKKANYNLGNALYKQDQYEPAITKYESLTSSKGDPQILSKYYYNLGNSYFKSQKIEKSIEAFKQSLRLNPKDIDAKHNLFLAQNLLKQQQQQQQQQNQNKDQNKQNNKNKKDQQKDQQDKDKQKNQDQQQNKQQQKDQQNQQDQKQKQGEQQISKEDAQRLLEALEQDEKNVMKKVEDQKALVRKVQVDKEW
jgi:tetratricopeptide (TPR) repeat protein